MKKLIANLLIFAAFVISTTAFINKAATVNALPAKGSDTLIYPDEKHFTNMRQLTFGGDNAEAYFSYDGKWLIFQHKNDKENVPCDQMYIGKIPTSPNEKFEPKM